MALRCPGGLDGRAINEHGQLPVVVHPHPFPQARFQDLRIDVCVSLIGSPDMRTSGSFPEQGFSYFHGFEQPVPEIPAFDHINEAICTRHHVLNPHAHATYEICYFLSGHALWTVGNERVELGPGDCFISRPGEVHQGRPDPDDPNHNVAIGFDPSGLPLLGTAPATGSDRSPTDIERAMEEHAAVVADPLGMRLIHGAQGTEHICRHILSELDRLERSQGAARPWAVLMIQTLLVQVLVHVTRCVLTQQAALAGPLSAPLRSELVALLRFLPDRLGNPPSLGEMAARTGLSPSHFSLAFKQAVGKTPLEYMTQLRIDEAARRLRSEGDSDITDIALDLGFSSSQHFSVVFKRYQGTTPSGYRRMAH